MKLNFVIFLLTVNPVFTLYDINKTMDMLYLSQATYCPDINTNNWSCKYCKNNVILEKVVENKGAKALVGYHVEYDALFVAFRGSQNIENWLDNIKIEFIHPYNIPNNEAIKWNDIGIEKGFYTVYKYIEDEIIKTLDNLSCKYKTTDILTTGHSLGSISTLLAFNLFYFYPDYLVMTDVTFGSPRIGNQEFVDAFKQTSIVSTRVTHYYDIVPHVPQEFLEYKHVHGEVWYNKENTNYVICNDYNSEDEQCSNSCAPLNCKSVSDHSNYIGVHMGIDGDC